MKHLYKLILATLLICSINKTQAQITVSYGYDELHRLKNCTYSNGIVVNYNYDALGNRTTVVVSGNTSCIAPANLSVTNIYGTSAILNWNYVAGQTYTVEYKLSTSSAWITASNSVNTGTYSLYGLSNNTTYSWRVKANCNSTYVDGANFTTQASCVAVTNLTANATSNSITLNWTYTAGYSYTLDYRIPPSTTWLNVSTSVNLNTITANGLSPNTTYDFRVKSNCSSNFTDSISVTTASNCTIPTANFSSISNGLSVSFTNTSTNATSYKWNLGNNQTSTQLNPSVNYISAGTYNVCLTAYNNCDSAKFCKNVNIVVTTITQNQLDNLISIFPNPSNGTFSVKVDNTIAKNVQLAIYDIEGKVVYQQQLTKQQTDIATQNLASGVYIINIQLSENEIVKHKLVIVK